MSSSIIASHHSYVHWLFTVMEDTNSSCRHIWFEYPSKFVCSNVIISWVALERNATVPILNLYYDVFHQEQPQLNKVSIYRLFFSISPTNPLAVLARAFARREKGERAEKMWKTKDLRFLLQRPKGGVDRDLQVQHPLKVRKILTGNCKRWVADMKREINYGNCGRPKLPCCLSLSTLEREQDSTTQQERTPLARLLESAVWKEQYIF